MSGQGANTGARPQGAADALLGLPSGTIVNETSPSTLSTSASLRPASRNSKCCWCWLLQPASIVQLYAVAHVEHDVTT